MSRRSTLPGAAELFRATGPADAVGAGSRPDEDDSDVGPGGRPPLTAVATGSGTRTGEGAGRAVADRSATESDSGGGPDAGRPVAESGLRGRRRPAGQRRPSGRERHDEKITVYVSPEELLDLEHARLTLRGEHGLAVDRGRIVREALAVVIADLEAKGDDSIIVRRLVGR